jgi:hypothetical protein
VRTRIAALFLLAAVTAMAADREFDHLVGAIESHYGIKRTHIPLMGLANFATKVAHPGGAHGFKIAIFEDVQSCEKCFDVEDLDDLIAKTAEGDLHPLVRTHSHGEATYILTGQIGKITKMLVATFSGSEATIVEVQVDLKTLLKTVGNPGRAQDWTD